MPTSTTPLTGTSKATTVTPFRSVLSAAKLCTGCSPGGQKAVTSEGRGRQGTGSEVRRQRSQRCYKKHPAGPLRAQWQQKARVRTHASVCSKEQRGRTLVGGPRRVCVCACVRACRPESAGKMAVPSGHLGHHAPCRACQLPSDRSPEPAPFSAPPPPWGWSPG